MRREGIRLLLRNDTYQSHSSPPCCCRLHLHGLDASTAYRRSPPLPRGFWTELAPWATRCVTLEATVWWRIGVNKDREIIIFCNVQTHSFCPSHGELSPNLLSASKYPSKWYPLFSIVTVGGWVVSPSKVISTQNLRKWHYLEIWSLQMELVKMRS